MRSLREAQRRLQAAILAEEAGDADDPGLAVYRHAYRARLRGALRANYPALARAMGDERFAEVADRYARARPSRRASIRWHGERLAGVLTDARLVDLARLEWALGMAFDAPDAVPLDPSDLAEVPVSEWDSLRLAPHPSVRILGLHWEIEPHWRRLRDGEPGPEEPPRPRRHTVVVWRRALEACWRQATYREGRALVALRMHGTLAAVCARTDEAGAKRVGAWFAGWVRDGLLVRATGG
jgi:hypothetical protein